MRFIIPTTAVALAAACALAAPLAAQAATFDLAGDFSNAVNPNGTWSFTQGTTPLTHFAQPGDSNALNAAAGNGYWGVGSTFSSAPFIIQVTANGAETPTYTNGDFLIGDVIAHSTNPGAGTPLFINWTAPGAGTISFSSALWYAHSPVQRSNDISVILGGSLLGTVTVDNAITRANAITTLAGTSLVVAAGDVLAFRFTPTAGQSFGSLAGISASVDFTPTSAGGVPEPATWAFMILGFGGVASAMRVRRRDGAMAATA